MASNAQAAEVKWCALPRAAWVVRCHGLILSHVMQRHVAHLVDMHLCDMCRGANGGIGMLNAATMRYAADGFVSMAPYLSRAEGVACLTVLSEQAHASDGTTGGPQRRMRRQVPQRCCRCVCGDQPSARHARRPLPESLPQLAFALALREALLCAARFAAA